MQDIRVCTADAPLAPWEDALRAVLLEAGGGMARVLGADDFRGLADVQQDPRLRGVIITGKKWKPGRTLRVKFMSIDNRIIERVKPYFLEWTKYANLGFEFVSSGDAEIRVSFEQGQGSWSYVGTDALAIRQDRPAMNFGWLSLNTPEDEYARVVLHEVGHALGMPHEHQHPRAGIPWDKEAVYRYYSGPPNNWDRATIDRNIFARYSESITQFSEFDRQSIMLYAIPNELTVGDWSVGWNKALSATDKRFIAEQYPGADAPPPPPPPPEDCGPRPRSGDYIRAWMDSGRNIPLSKFLDAYQAKRKEYEECRCRQALLEVLERQEGGGEQDV